MICGNITQRYNISELIKLYDSTESLTNSAYAIAYAQLGFSVFPCDAKKTPIVVQGLGFVHGFKNATTDLKLIAKAWHRYPNAGIGFALPEDIIVFDCDVLKDGNKIPILKEGTPDMMGLRSFQWLMLELNIEDEYFDTLSVDTQSGGRHFYYKMPPGISSFSRTAALPGLDLKGFGGYVLLPPSKGKHGEYRFRNIAAIKEIPEALLEWIQKFKSTPNGEIRIPEPQHIENQRVTAFVNEILPAWNAAIRQHRGNYFRLAIAGTLYHYGWPESDAEAVMKLIISKTETPGLSDKNAVHYTYVNGRAGKPVFGFSTLKRMIEELEEKQ